MSKVVINTCFGCFGLSDEALKLLGVEHDGYYENDVMRTDPVLVNVVEQLGERASAKDSQLKVVDMPNDVEWSIKQHDGNEWIAENHRTWD